MANNTYGIYIQVPAPSNMDTTADPDTHMHEHSEVRFVTVHGDDRLEEMEMGVIHMPDNEHSEVHFVTVTIDERLEEMGVEASTAWGTESETASAPQFVNSTNLDTYGFMQWPTPGAELFCSEVIDCSCDTCLACQDHSAQVNPRTPTRNQASGAEQPLRHTCCYKANRPAHAAGRPTAPAGVSPTGDGDKIIQGLWFMP